MKKGKTKQTNKNKSCAKADFYQKWSESASFWVCVTPMDCSPPGSSVHGILQTRKLEQGTSLVVQWLRLHTPTAGSLGSIPGLERSPGERKGCPLQYSGLENSMDCIVNGVAKSRTWLSDFHFTIIESGELESSFLQIEATANHLFYVCFIVCLV